MKTGNKVLLILASALVIYLAVGLLFIPRTANGQPVPTADETATTADDSLSYAVSLIIARDMPRAIEELGISDENIAAFVKGLTDAFPADGSPSSVAYAHGVVIGATAMEMLEDAMLDLRKQMVEEMEKANL